MHIQFVSILLARRHCVPEVTTPSLPGAQCCPTCFEASQSIRKELHDKSIKIQYGSLRRAVLLGYKDLTNQDQVGVILMVVTQPALQST